MKKTNIIIITLAFLSLLAWKIYDKTTGSQLETRGGNKPVPVETSPVIRTNITHAAEFTGTLLPSSRFIAAPKVAGRLEKLLVNIGDIVNNGDIIAVLESAEYAQQVAQAEAELHVSIANRTDSKSSLEIAEREYQRAKELFEQKIASEAELDQANARLRAAEAKHNIAEAQIRQKEAALEAAKVRLSYTQIAVSWNEPEGKRFVSERFVDEGAMLRANDPIVAIVDINPILAVIHVIERDFPLIKAGQNTVITTDAFPARRFKGTVTRRAPVLKEESRQARVEIEVPNPETLLAPGMFVRCRINFEEHPNATVVPSAAIIRRNGQDGVFLADPDNATARFTPVTAGVADNNCIEIISPEIQGHVVTMGHHLLEDKSKILIPNPNQATTSADLSPDIDNKGGKAGEKQK